MSRPALDPPAWPALLESITRWTGFHPDAIWSRAVESSLQPLLDDGWSPPEIVAAAQRDDARLRHRLSQAVPVGETFFFRIPEHFAFVRDVIAPRWAAEPARNRAVWSAGCATGEEAYSLAAVLRGAGVADFEVVGTDLVESNVETARAGRYGRWSLRAGLPPAEDPFVEAPEHSDAREVAPELRARVRFEVRNLLDGAPAPCRFDLVFCRNVLIYFTPAAAARAVDCLASALAPGGVVAFATMDVGDLPPPLVRVGSPELQFFQRPPVPVAAERPQVPRVPDASPPPAPLARERAPASASLDARPLGPEPLVSVHLRVLAHLDRGERNAARALLHELQQRAPEYLPAMLEQALLDAREGRRAPAIAAMRSVLDRAQGLPGDAPVSGPEVLPASFYAAAARSFLGQEFPR